MVMRTKNAGGSMVRKLCGCGNLVQLKCYDAAGNPRYKSRCATCNRVGRRSKKDHCERCGFIPEDLVQLDVDHKNGNSSDNRARNLQTLCANCHRLKSKLSGDWNKRYEKV